MVPVTGVATWLPLARVPLWLTVPAERACELLLTVEEELLVAERACELPAERAVELLLTEDWLPEDRVVLDPLERVALLPLERELLPVERVTCWLLPEERVVLPEERLVELEDERLLEELLLLERVVVVPPPERVERD